MVNLRLASESINPIDVISSCGKTITIDRRF